MRILTLLFCLLVAGAASAGPQTTNLSDPSETGHVTRFVGTSVDGARYTIGKAFPVQIIGFNHGSLFTGILYACDGAAIQFSLATCDQVTTLDADVVLFLYTTLRLNYVVEVTTAEDPATPSRLTIKGTMEQVSQGGVSAQEIEDSRGSFRYVIDGLAASFTPNPLTYIQVPLGIVELVATRPWIGVSADRNLICNIGTETVSITAVSQPEITQTTSGGRGITFKIGDRIGEGPLVDGDESPYFQGVGIFTTTDSIAHPVMHGISDWPVGNCFGVMALRTDGGASGDLTYTATGGGTSFNGLQALN